ncbi:PLD nuclease N-terminal domain-containing protein [Paenibacillus paridis]|jgi:hypothetical protein|uniref:PLD nuclease N-terminal domain-containing protein n=1 Tax=Paenibacillus paridis TaxID=2583376 RepID=UPI001EE42FFD|nr:PLD nuclease N-terminal domain-containing protein [Paenibacillus paridis]
MKESIDLSQILPIIAPIIVIQLILMVIALVLCAKAERTRGPKWVWVLIIIFVNIFGPIAFFIAGRRTDG